MLRLVLLSVSSCPSEGSSVSKESLEPWVILGCHLMSLGCTSRPCLLSLPPSLR